MACSAAVDTQCFWQLIDEARGLVGDPFDADAVARQAEILFAALPPDEIVAAEQVFWDLMSDAYRNPLWAAAHIINGGCSDDGFDYFRGWLILQGRAAFERAVEDPDALANLPAVRRAAHEEADLEGESALGMASHAYTRATGQPIPHTYTITCRDLDPAWNFEFDDRAEMNRRLPLLARLYEF